MMPVASKIVTHRCCRKRIKQILLIGNAEGTVKPRTAASAASWLWERPECSRNIQPHPALFQTDAAVMEIKKAQNSPAAQTEEPLDTASTQINRGGLLFLLSLALPKQMCLINNASLSAVMFPTYIE